MSGTRLRASIRARLITQLLAGAVLLALLVVLVVRSYARDLASESQDVILAASVTSILDASAVRNGKLALDIPYAAFTMLGNTSDDRVFYAVTRNGAFLTGYEDLPRPAPGTGPGLRFRSATYKGAGIRMATAARRLAIDGQPEILEVTVAQTRDGLRQRLVAISRTVAGFGIGFFALAAFLGLLTVRSASGPLRALADSVARRGPEDLRPVSAPIPTEMAPLVGALNGFMGRLDTALNRSEDLIAEAAHRVRTPLATVRTKAEITLRRVDKPENRQAMREMIQAIDESSRAAGQLLDHAMVSFRAEHLVRGDIDLNRLGAEVVDRLRPVADLRDIDLTLIPSPDPTPTRGDPILLQSALSNLIDNAIKYAPADSKVSVMVTRGGNTSGIVGSGLGLTIAEEVARAHGGTLHLSNKTRGDGACVRLSLPLT
jgi:two-component system sensor histidine kinase TctE